MLLDRWENVVSDIAVGMGYELIDLELDESGLVRIFIDIVDNTRDVSVERLRTAYSPVTISITS